MNRMRASDFVKYLQAALADHCGYILGTRGQDPKTLNEWYITGQYTGRNQKQAIKWRDTAPRVYDCNGLLEGAYLAYEGADLNKDDRFDKAYKIYQNACEKKGKGLIPAEYRAPGAALFVYSDGLIRHIAFLEKPNGDDWDVIEACGLFDGVVRTRLSQRGFTHWGLVDRLIDYESSPTFVRVVLSSEGSALNVRLSPSFDGQIVGTLNNGEIAEVLSVEGRWRKIQTDTMIGYCHSDNLKIETPARYRLTIVSTDYPRLRAISAECGGEIEALYD